MCQKKCHQDSCPFAFTEESERVQNFGCLPSPLEIVAMRVYKKKTWACHSNPEVPCKGAVKFLKSKNLESNVLDKNLITEDNISKDLVNFSKKEIDDIRKIFLQ